MLSNGRWNRIHARAAGAALAALLVVTLSGCVSKTDYDVLLAERNSLDTSKASLESEVKELSARLERLEASNTSLDSERVALIDQIETLSVEREEMESSLRELAASRDLLTSEFGTLTSELEALSAQHEETSRLTSTYRDLVDDLESEVTSGQIQIEQLREGVRLNLPQNVLFALGSAALEPTGVEVLRKVAKNIDVSTYRVEVQGHTDSLAIYGALKARYPTNWELAGARAAVVVRVLEDAGTDPTRLSAVSMGQYQPIAPNDTPEGRAENRRIEIRLLLSAPADEPAAQPEASADQPAVEPEAAAAEPEASAPPAE